MGSIAELRNWQPVDSVNTQIPYVNHGQGWWVAKVSAQSRIMANFLRDLNGEAYCPRIGGRPVSRYAFIRAGRPVNAWMCRGFKGWLLSGTTRAVVDDSELYEFRQQVERYKTSKEFRREFKRLLRRFNAIEDTQADSVVHKQANAADDSCGVAALPRIQSSNRSY